VTNLEPPSTPPPSSPRAGEPAPRGTFDGRARAFREQQTQRRSRRRELFGQLLVVAIIVVGIYAIVSAKPFSPSNNSGPPNPGPPIVITFTTPVVGTVSCGDGGTAYTEQVDWTNASQPVTTGDVTLRVYELYDGDIVNDMGIIPNATTASVCAGAPPNPATLAWYVVVSSPSGAIQLTYAFSPGWASVTNGAWNVPIENGTMMTIVMGASIAGRGFGFAVVGFASGSPVRGSIPL
jgi:hypothetical protein